IGASSLRLKGDYFALVTIAFAFIVYYTAKNWVSVTRGPMGLPGIPGFTVFGLALDSTFSYFVLVFVFVIITIFIVRRIVDSPFGRVLKSIREDEIAAQALGKDTTKHKLLAFV
ncbi:MAG: branched-chain amino acid ABC transporter permease, partial [Proteobacteria bacterium]|nr:branched-chain amino acid ABC transporter permease [Pseudomonadota bacterium]